MNWAAGNTAHTGDTLGGVGDGEIIVGDGTYRTRLGTEAAGCAIDGDGGNQPGPFLFAVVFSGNRRTGTDTGTEFFEDLFAEIRQLLTVGGIGASDGKCGKQAVCSNGRNGGNGMETSIPSMIFHLSQCVIHGTVAIDCG